MPFTHDQKAHTVHLGTGLQTASPERDEGVGLLAGEGRQEGVSVRRLYEEAIPWPKP